MTETLKWVKAQGGVKAMYELNKKKAGMLYDEIDRNSLFVGTAAKEDRSLMNVCFVMAPGHEDLQDEFLAFAKERGTAQSADSAPPSTTPAPSRP